MGSAKGSTGPAYRAGETVPYTGLVPIARHASALHLVRHGEVDNPGHLVYASLPGFGLSELGWRQVEAAADHLAGLDVTAVVSSPLQRAVETAAAIAAVHRIAVTTDPRLREWELGNRWAGRPWDALDSAFPGELDAYLADPADLPFAPESLADVAVRVAAAAEQAWDTRRRPGHVVLVGHQDPMEAGRRRLCGRGLQRFHDAKPGHAAVVSLVPTGVGWDEADVWAPRL